MDTMAYFVHRIIFLVAVVCITASANLMVDYNWPVPNPNINQFPHESSCHYYYLMLSEEDISVMKCPDGQLFDYVKHSCISDKEHIHCWSRHFGKIKHGHIIKHKKHFKCPYPWGKYPNLHDCTKYHLCLNGKSRVKKCAPFELFDKVSRKCIASIDAVCADKTDVVEHGYVCPKTWGSFTYSKDCSKYYECLQRKPSLRTCQKDNLFDDRLRKCAPKDRVYCGVRHNPYVTTDVPETSSIPISQETSTIFKEVTSNPSETSSTFKEVTSTPEEISSTFKVGTSAPPEISSTFKEVKSTNQPTSTETSSPLAIVENATKQTKQDKSLTAAVEINKQPQEMSFVTENASGTNEFTEGSSTTEKESDAISFQSTFAEKSEESKKDVSTEERDTEDVSKKLVNAATQKHEGADSSAANSKTGCPPEDAMCITEKDGTIVKCSSSKDLQPHPKDERRFLDCTESKIRIYTCPPNLTFAPKEKKCHWQFVMK